VIPLLDIVVVYLKISDRFSFIICEFPEVDSGNILVSAQKFQKSLAAFGAEILYLSVKPSCMEGVVAVAGQFHLHPAVFDVIVGGFLAIRVIANVSFHSFTLPTVPPKNVTRITRISVTVLGVTFVTVNSSAYIRALHSFTSKSYILNFDQ
jgi:hypothetical protein